MEGASVGMALGHGAGGEAEGGIWEVKEGLVGIRVASAVWGEVGASKICRKDQGNQRGRWDLQEGLRRSGGK